MALSFLFQYKQGKVGPDGKELIPQESPKVNGYGFVATPSPAPGKKVFFLLFFPDVRGLLLHLL